jgi:hypothetical protein
MGAQKWHLHRTTSGIEAAGGKWLPGADPNDRHDNVLLGHWKGVRMVRSVAAIAIGFCFIVLLSLGADALMRQALPNLFDPSGRMTQAPVLGIVLVYVAAIAMTGCYLTARLAPARPLRHALILGGFGLLFSIPGTVAGWDLAPAWYHIISPVMVLPYAWLGGWLGERYIARKGGTATR